MPQSLSKVIIYIIFSTKDREPWLDKEIRPRIHSYLATVCRDVDGEAYRVGGVSDHVHIVTTLPRTLAASGFDRAYEEDLVKMDQRSGAKVW